MAENSVDKAEKLKALEAARLQIEKQYGQGSLMKLGEGYCQHQCCSIWFYYA